MTNYQRYTNRDLENIINDNEEEKFINAIFKRHYDRPFTDPEARREAQKRNALQYYYRNQLIKKYETFSQEDNEKEP